MICEKYSCKMADEACASRHMNALSSKGQSPVGNFRYGSDDFNCLSCKTGSATLKKVGTDGVAAYRKSLDGIRRSIVQRKRRGNAR